MANKTETAMVARNQLEAVLRDPGRRVEITNAMPFDDPKVKQRAMQQLIDFARNQEGKVAQCSDKSKFECCLQAARLGLPLNSPARLITAVPFGNVATPIVEYRGLIALGRRYAGVKEVHTGLIYEHDDYEWTESDFTMSRKLGDRGEVIGAYAKLICEDSNACEVMTKEEVEHVRSKSRAKSNGPWVTDWGQMARKTVCRRAFNHLDWSPKGAELLGIADRTEYNYDDTATVEVVGPVPKEKKGSQAVLESLQGATLPPGPISVDIKSDEGEPTITVGVDPETGEVIPPEVGKPAPPPKPRAPTRSPSNDPSALHLLEAQRLCKAHRLPVWQKLTEPRKKLIRERMEAEEIASGKEFWALATLVLEAVTPDYYENWSEQVQLDVFLRVPKRGNPDHWTKLLEGPIAKTKNEPADRIEGAPPASPTLLNMMGGQG